jgi:hypothetical protein
VSGMRVAVTAAYMVVAGAPFPNAVARMFLISLLGVVILSFAGQPTRFPIAILYLLSLGSLMFVLGPPPEGRSYA